MEGSGRQDPLNGHSPWRSGSGLGKHEQVGQGSERGALSRFRFFLRPRTALGIALVVLLLSVVSVVRVATLEGDASATDLEGGSSAEQSLAAEQDLGSTAVGDADTPGLGYGLAAEGEDARGSTGSEVIVHVTGAVSSPGVVHLSAGTRVLDAIEAAGGATEEADISAINLASFASDGSQIHVPTVGEAPRESVPSTGGSSLSGGSAGGGGCIDLNTASEAELEGLDGVGPKLAARIAGHRESNGPFSSSADLVSVAGIGPVLSARIAEGACQ